MTDVTLRSVTVFVLHSSLTLVWKHMCSVLTTAMEYPVNQTYYYHHRPHYHHHHHHHGLETILSTLKYIIFEAKQLTGKLLSCNSPVGAMLAVLRTTMVSSRV